MILLKTVVTLLVIGIVSAKSKLKQGGAACYPQQNYCMNGGTCYTQYTTQPVYNPTTVPTTTSCVPPVLTTTQVSYTTTQYVIVTQPVCGCQPTYVGDRCETPVTVPSYTQATTTVPSYTHAPATVPSYTQPPAQQTGCAAVQCLNGGTCVELYTSPFAVCRCPAAYTGLNCETLVQVNQGCSAITCLNGGTCVAIDVAPFGVCQCSAAFTGNTCETFVDPTQPAQGCAGINCQNGGTCVTIDVAPFGVCQCPVTFTGLTCETQVVVGNTVAPIETCASNPCLNGGECRTIDTIPLVICVCPVGFTGRVCETVLTLPPTGVTATLPPVTAAPVTFPPVTFPPVTFPPVTFPPVVTVPAVTNPIYRQPQTTTPPCVTPVSYTQPPTQPGCIAVQCQNGGTCQEITASPYTVCVCPSDFTGLRCETAVSFVTPVPVTQNPYPQATTSAPIQDITNLCAVYANRGISICQNGGQCQFISAGQIACVCTSDFVGQYCETSVLTTCTGQLASQCHRDNGVCQYDGSCLCNPGWCGPTCSISSTPTTPAATGCAAIQCLNGGTCVDLSVAPFGTCQCPAAYTGSRCETLVNLNPAAGCSSLQCLNGGTCQEINVAPFGVCQCPADYTGATCETLINLVTNPYGAPVASASPRNLPFEQCKPVNFTVVVANTGAFVARFKVSYKVDGVWQPPITSQEMAIIGNFDRVVVPWYSSEIQVDLERLGGTWSRIALDTSIDGGCAKCYKLWGGVSTPSWDYIECRRP